MDYTRDGGHEQWQGNPLDTARESFGWLTVGPHPVVVDGRLFDHLPDRDVPVDELRDLLLRPDCPRATWDEVWAHVILKSRLQGATWTIVAVGLALPTLIPIAARLTAHYVGDPTDIHAEVLRGFLDALDTVDLDQGRIMIRLRWAAYRAGHRALIAALDGPTPRAPGFRSSEPKPPSGHPDLVLARAVAVGVLTQTEAALIGDTRLDEVTLSEWAAAHNVTYAQVQRARHRAEQRLAIWLSETAEPVDEADPTTGAATARLGLTAGPDSPSRSRRVAKNRESGLSAQPPDSGLQGCG
ncbi:hypothetical protein [Prauserella flavalba]|uniref:hypothetical protein n=1 Tax=Prauserella flavalba TaxID=1477506 RepID=UPI0036EC9BDA